MRAEEKFQKWVRWLTTIDNEVTSLFLYRDTWRAFAAMLDSNKSLPPSHFFQVLSASYAASQAVAVRRITDPGKPSRPVVSLACLMADIRDNPKLLTRDRWLTGLPDATERTFVGRDWDKQFAGSVGAYLDPDIPRRDIDRLSAAAEPIVKYVDQYLAHRDPSPQKTVPKYEDLHSAIEVIGEVFRRYYLLITAADRPILGPVLPPSWLRIFEIPWMPPRTGDHR